MMNRLQNASSPFEVTLAGRTFQAVIYRGQRQISDTMRLQDGSDSFILRHSKLVCDGVFTVMREGTDQYLVQEGKPVLVYWMGDVIEQLSAQ